MWYKLSGKTDMAIWITLAGLAVTVAVNLAFMPRFSYWAAAFGHLASYLVMFIISAALGQKYYPIPYKWGRIGSLVAIMLLFYGVAALLDRHLFHFAGWDTDRGLLMWKLGVHTVLIAAYAGAAWLILRRGRNGSGSVEEVGEKM